VSSGPRRVVFSIPLGYYARTLLRSGVLDRLLETPATSVLILTPAHQEAAFTEEFGHDGRVSFGSLHPGPDRLPLWERAFWKVAWALRERRALFLPLMAAHARIHLVTDRCRYAECFESFRPTLVVTGSPGYHSARDIPVIRDARRYGVATLCVVYSWDNLLTNMNGLMPTRPDWLAVWNERMQREAITMHHYPPERVAVVGPPHFDIYQDRRIYLNRRTFCEKLGLDPTRALITVAASHNAMLDQSFVLEALTRSLRAERLARPAQILWRAHPLDRTDFYRRHAGRADVVFDCTLRRSEMLKWDPDRAEMVHLANILYHSDVVVNVASTITIEAAILDRPVVNVAWSPIQPDRFQQEIVVGHYQKHYAYVLEHRCTFLATSEDDLISSINRYLEDPAIHRRERREMAEEMCYRLDGKAHQRIADLILSLA